MIFQYTKLETTGGSELFAAQGWDAGEMTAIGGISIGSDEPRVLWA